MVKCGWWTFLEDCCESKCVPGKDIDEVLNCDVVLGVFLLFSR